MMTHEEARDMLAAAALGALDEADRERLLAHVRDCEECGRLLGQYRDVAASLAGLVPYRRMHPTRSERLRARLIARAGADRHRGPPDSEDPPVTPLAARAASRVDRWMGWMVAAGLAALLLTHHAYHRPLAFGWLAAAALALALVAVCVYAVLQRDRVSALQDRVAVLERAREPRRDVGREDHTASGTAEHGPDR